MIEALVRFKEISKKEFPSCRVSLALAEPFSILHRSLVLGVLKIS